MGEHCNYYILMSELELLNFIPVCQIQKEKCFSCINTADTCQNPSKTIREKMQQQMEIELSYLKCSLVVNTRGNKIFMSGQSMIGIL